jgi:hypothetical protein
VPIFPQEQITIRRYAAQTIAADYRPAAQVPTDVAAWARVQPPSNNMDLVPEGFRTKRRRRFNSTTEIKVADEATGIPADEIIWNGTTWRVFHVDPWRGLGYIRRHWVAEAIDLQQLSPPAGT